MHPALENVRNVPKKLPNIYSIFAVLELNGPQCAAVDVATF